MSWVTGSATDYDDLMDKLITFLTTDVTLVSLNQNWTVLKDEIIVSDRYLYLMGPGLASNDQIHVNLKRVYSSSSGSHNWGFRGASSYDGGLSYETQPGTSEPTYLCLSNGTMTYWFFASGRRFIVIVKIGTVFVSSYAGLIYPYALPSEYAYPLFIAATDRSENQLYSTAGLQTSAFWKGGSHSGVTSNSYLRMVGGFWLFFSQGAADPVGRNWPYWSVASNYNSDPGIADLTKNLDSSYSLLPIILYSSTYDTKDIFGELEGVFHVPGTDLNSEDTLTIGGDTYLCIQNVEAVNRNDFAAILME